MTPAEFAQTINPRRDAVLRSRNSSAPQPASAAPNTATQNRWSELKTGYNLGAMSFEKALDRVNRLRGV
ncbi:MAG: hypothetical protein M9944_17545, partial [Rhizobiaceae bacterium]|nr:hypothetical protein [Rhizobiaceae bacterium]